MTQSWLVSSEIIREVLRQIEGEDPETDELLHETLRNRGHDSD